MKLGFGLPVSGSWATPETMVTMARRAEELGYASLWTFQRLLSPAGDEGTPGYRSVHDPVVALAYVAAVTERVRLGVAILNAPYYAPIVLAKQLASLDVVSGGRLDAGLGLGWSLAEFQAVGVPFERRGARTEELIGCLHAAWGPDPAEFHGEFFHLPRALVDPKPVQHPHPPLLLGGSAEPALRRAGRIADGWISASRHDLTRIGAAVGVVTAAAREAGRDADRLRIVVRGAVSVGAARHNAEGDRMPLSGSVGQVRGDLAALAEQGVTEVFLDLNFDSRIGSPDADAGESVRHAHEVLEAFAPAADR